MHDKYCQAFSLERGNQSYQTKGMDDDEPAMDGLAIIFQTGRNDWGQPISEIEAPIHQRLQLRSLNSIVLKKTEFRYQQGSSGSIYSVESIIVS